MFHLMHSMMFCTALRAAGHRLGADGRMAEIIRLRAMGVVDLMLYLYPRMFAVDADEQCTPLPLVQQSFAEGCCFLVHTLDNIFIWVSIGASKEFLANAFGVAAIEELPKEVPKLETAENRRLNELINECWKLSAHYLPVEVIPQGDQREEVFGEILRDEEVGEGPQLGTWIGQIRSF